MILCLLIAAGFPARTVKAAGLPNGTQTFESYAWAEANGVGYYTSSDGCFMFSVDQHDDWIGADPTGAFIYDSSISPAPVTEYLEIKAIGELGSFQLSDVGICEFYESTDAPANYFTDVQVVGYANDAAIVQTAPYSSPDQGIACEAKYNIDFSGFSGKTINKFRVYFTAQPGTPLNSLTMFNFTIANAAGLPTVSITSMLSGATNAAKIPVTITFGASVTGFTAEDLIVGNGTVGDFAGSGTTYTANVTPTGDGTVTVNVGAGVAQDSAGNPNQAAAQFSIVSDRMTPSVVISSTLSSPTNAGTIPVTITFSEVVTGFELSDITVGNGTKGTLTGSGTTYTVNVTPAGDGTVTVDIGAGAAQDVVGNNNTAAIQFGIQSDRTPPTGAAVSINAGAAYTKTASVGLGLSAIGADQMMVSESAIFAGAAYEPYAVTKSFTLTGGDGTKTVYVKYRDIAGNETSMVSDTIELDTTVPSVVISSTLSGSTNTVPIPMTITFSEAVTGFGLSNISVGNGSAADFAGSGAVYTVNLTPTGDGPVMVDIAAGAAHDVAGNNSLAATQFRITSDTTAPTVEISSALSGSTNAVSIPVTITFSEAVTGFELSDLTVGNGNAGTFAGSGATYTVNLIPAGDGAVTVDIGAGAAKDAAGNSSTAAQFNIISDRTAPILTNTATSSDNTRITIDASMNESGIVYYIIIPDGGSAPTSSEVMAGLSYNGVSVIAHGSQPASSAPYSFSVVISGLSAGTTYDIYLTASDAASNLMSMPVRLDEMTPYFQITAFDVITDVDAGYAGSARYTDAAAVIATLPGSVSANGNSVSIPVTAWVDTDSYRPDQAGSYTFTAVLGALPAGYLNPAGYTATVEVILTVPVYTVTYNKNGSSGTAPVDSNQYHQGDTVILPGAGGLTRPGYRFAGWALSQTSGAIGASTVTMGSSNLILYAVWAANASQSAAPSGSGPSSESIKITVDVKQGDSDDTVSQLLLVRSTGTDGRKSDTISYEAQKASETVNKLKAEGMDTARIMLPDSRDEVFETTVNIPSESVEILGGVNLQLDTKEARFDISKEALRNISRSLKDDLYFRLIPLGEQELKGAAIERALPALSVMIANADKTISVIGNPIVIETNMPSIEADLTLPLSGLVIPSDPVQKEALLQQLAVFIEHSNGVAELVRGELVELKNGAYGLKFRITRFSVFMLIKSDALQKSSASSVTKVSVPKKASIKGNKITATVNNETASLTVKVSVSSKATWKLYSDKACTKVIAKNKIKLKAGTNTVYLKVTAENRIDHTLYTLKINRKAAEVKYKAHVKLGLIRNKDYAEKVVKLFEQDYAAANTAIIREGKYYRSTLDFTDQASAKKACNDMVKRKYISNYYITG